MRTLVIDNYDSFTFNIVQAIAGVTGEEPMVTRNDALAIEDVRALAPDAIVISPGPGSPVNDADLGVSRDVILDPPCPVLGVCLGFQGMALVYGSAVVRAAEPWHGRGSRIVHDGEDLFRGIPSPFFAIRYHSLCVPRLAGEELVATAFTDDGVVMALRHVRKPLWGVQFHPESIASEYGPELFTNFRDLARSRSAFAPMGWIKPEIPAPPPPLPNISVRFRRIDDAPPAESIFVGLFASRSGAVWLDSSASGGLSRFSFMGDASGPGDFELRYRSQSRTIEISGDGGPHTVSGSVFDFLRGELAKLKVSSRDLPFPFCGGFIGYFGYELKGECGGRYRHASRLPDAYFLKVSRFVACDNETGDCYVVAVGEKNGVDAWIEETVNRIGRISEEIDDDERDRTAPESSPHFRPEQSRERYQDSIGRALEKIGAGESYQVCLTNRLRSPFDGDPLALYRRLRRSNPAPFAAYLNAGDFSVLSASPERFLRIDAGGGIESRPIKGTIGRSGDPAEDRRLADALRHSVKNQAENLMIVDLVRNDLGRVARTGSVEVPALMPVETYATVHHIVSTVRGQLADGHDPIDCIRAAFPGGSMTGAPKLRTMEIIDELESSARGVYSGTLGYLSFDGALDLSIVIRTMVVAGGEIEIGTGGGIVALSDPDEEILETELKAEALIEAVRSCPAPAGRTARKA